MRTTPTLEGRAVDRVVETHVSWLFFTRDTVIKLKKPVKLGFLDFTEPAVRRRACEDEVRLNRRLAPGVYRGVRDVVRDGDTVRLLGPCPGAEACTATDHAVEMVRLPDADCLATRLARGDFPPALLRRLARRLARFHAECPTGAGIDRHGAPRAVASLVTENLDQLAPFVDTRLPRTLFEAARSAQTGFLAEHADRLVARVRGGHIRDGHGDMHLEHFFLHGDPEQIVAIDCIEFSDRYRIGDTASDVAFLAMSFDLAGRDDLAEQLVAEYAVEAQDPDLYRVVDFYRLYRALVRLKVACLSGDPGEVDRHVALVRRLLAPRPRPPFLLATTGLVATGKSAVAEAIAGVTNGVWLGSDRVRKARLGLAPTESAVTRMGQGAYTAELKDAVYDDLVRFAAAVLDSGRPAILDATYPTPARRAKVSHLARDHGVPLVWLHLEAPRAVIRARLEAREGRTDLVSDARVEHFDALVEGYLPPDEVPRGTRLTLSTETAGLEATVEAVLARLPSASPRPSRSPSPRPR